MSLMLRHQPAAAAQPRDSSKQDSKYGSADKNSKFKATRYSDHVDKHRRGNRGHGGNTLSAYSLLHITCNCDDTDIDTMLHHNGQQSHFTLRHYSVRHRC